MREMKQTKTIENNEREDPQSDNLVRINYTFMAQEQTLYLIKILLYLVSGDIVFA